MFLTMGIIIMSKMGQYFYDYHTYVESLLLAIQTDNEDEKEKAILLADEIARDTNLSEFDIARAKKQVQEKIFTGVQRSDVTMSGDF